ncbi:MAG: type I secretion system permease/ATPase [Pseudomonadota bacterium]|jgi:ATP-binding cassette subfamily C protein LapB|nr:MAG: type I secretion system permease/ATPase [Pseudomonadota bacterium]
MSVVPFVSPAAETRPQPAVAPANALERVLMHACEQLGRPSSLAVIRAALPDDAAQVGPDHLPSVFAHLGVAATPTALARADLDTLGLPLIVVAADGSAGVITEVVDSATVMAAHVDAQSAPGPLQLRPMGREALAALPGTAWVLRVAPPADAREPGWRQRYAWLIEPIRENWWSYAQVAVAALVINVLGLAISFFSMVVYDRVLPTNSTASLIALAVGVSIAIAFDFTVKTLRSSFIDGAGARVDVRIGERLFDQILGMRLAARKDSVGSLAGVMREMESLREVLTSATLAAVVDLPFVLFFLVVISFVGGPLAIVPAIAVPVVLALGLFVRPVLKEASATAFSEGRNKQGVLVETIGALELVKASGAARMMRRRWRQSVVHHTQASTQSRLTSQLALHGTMFAQQAANVGIVVYGAVLASRGEVSMGAIIACVMLSGRALAPLGQIAGLLTRIHQAVSAFKALDAVMQSPLDREQSRRYLSRPKLAGRIEFRDVSFAYPGQSGKALDGVSFRIEPGERVAIVGRIGSGKSTVLRLVLGLHEPAQGAILIDDTDLRQIDPLDVRAGMGSVLQDNWLFSGTVRENIAIDAHGVTDADVLRAARIAGVHDFIGTHPSGYDLNLTERGEGLSGGQRQSICIARALARDPSILVFDEPTSMMDTGTEAELIARLREATPGKTLIVVTHRSSVLDLVDRVIVMDKGKVIADGPKSILNVARNR